LQALSRTLLGIPQDTEEENPEQISFSSTGKAYATANLEGVHEMLVIDGYSEDERSTFKVRTVFLVNIYCFHGSSLTPLFCSDS
jgi:hypothetical protein